MTGRFAVLFTGLLAASLAGCGSAPAEISVGSQAPSFKLQSTETGGRLVASESLKGRTTVLVFWSTTCPICLKELDDLRAIHESGTAAIVAVALDDDNDRVRRFLKVKEDRHEAIKFPVLFGNEEVFSRFDGYGIPYTLVLDRSLTIRHKANGRIAPDDLTRIIREIGDAPNQVDATAQHGEGRIAQAK